VYLDVDNSPLYPFGFGLTYTTFEYQRMHVLDSKVKKDGSVQVHANIRNLGTRAGVEIVQLYIRDEVASRTPPVAQLCGFEKVHLQPGQQQLVKFRIEVGSLGVFSPDLSRFEVEPGFFTVWVSANSNTENGLRGRFEVVE